MKAPTEKRARSRMSIAGERDGPISANRISDKADDILSQHRLQDGSFAFS